MTARKMILNSCFKKYQDQAIGKVVSPERTCETALKKLRNLSPAILAHYLEVQTQLGIPQVRVIGTEDFQAFTRAKGQNGKGHSQAQALASGLMEFVERYSCGKYLRNGISLTGSFRELEARGNPFHLEDILKYPRLGGQQAIGELRNAKLAWYKGYTLEEKEVYIPMNLIRYLLEGSNGMAAGNSLEEALLHGICEVIERHFRTLIEESKIKTPFIDKSTIQLPIAKQLIKKAEALGQEIYVKDFSLGFGMPIIGAIRKTGRTRCTVTVGVAAGRDEALARALTENSQAQGAKDVTYRISEVGYHFAKNRSVALQDIADIADSNILREIQKAKALLDKERMQVFFLIATDPDLNIPSVYVYIPQCRYAWPPIRYRNIWMGLILESLVVKDYAGIKKYIRKARRDDKANQAIYAFYQGMGLRQQLKYGQAAPYLLRAEKNVPGMARLEPTERLEIRSFAIAHLALCYQAAGKSGAAIASLATLYRLNKYFSLKQLYSYFSAGLLPGEKKLFGRVYALHREIGAIIGKNLPGGPAEFLKILHQYLQRKGEALALLRRAEALRQRKRYTEAIAQINKAAAVDRLIALRYNIPRLLGISYQGMGNFSRAITEFRKAERIDPLDFQINIFIARCLKQQGNAELSKKEITRALLKVEKPVIRRRVGG
jgi:YcaO-like protein with predicted kinase domain